MFVLRIRDKFRNYTYNYICVYTPVEGKRERQKHQFYEWIWRTYSQGPSHDINIILVDMNGKVETENWTGIAVGNCE